jgi:hypothetical protein
MNGAPLFLDEATVLVFLVFHKTIPQMSVVQKQEEKKCQIL